MNKLGYTPYGESIEELLSKIEDLYYREVNSTARWQKKYQEYDRDKEIQSLKETIDRLHNHSLLQLSDKELEANRAFRYEHYTRHGGGKALSTYIYTLTGTGIGTVITVKCPVCGEEKDITDIESW